MKPRRKVNFSAFFIGALFIGACVFALTHRQKPDEMIPRAQWKDDTPLGGKGLRLLLERLGYRAQLETERINGVPKDAGVWLILDPFTGFSKAEAKQLLGWVNQGGTLIWAVPDISNPFMALRQSNAHNSGIAALTDATKLQQTYSMYRPSNQLGEPLPPLTPLNPVAVSAYWSGVKQATASGHGLTIKRPFLEIAGNPAQAELARIDYGQGHIILAPDPLLFTNYALSKPDNAVLVTNLIGVHLPPGQATVYFDEREHGEDTSTKPTPSLLYYLSRPPLSYAMLQLFVASLLLWALYGRRLGAPVPLPDNDPVTRAGQFATAMGMLFQKAGRPQAAGVIIGEEFRRAVARRLGMSTAQSDQEIAQRAGAVTGMPTEMIARLLAKARTPAAHEADVLSDAQEMEYVLRRLKTH